MRYVGMICMAGLLFLACSRDRYVHLSGRSDGVDSVVIFQINDRRIEFPLNENRLFTGQMELESATYATMFFRPSNRRGPLLFLSPGENVEMVLYAQTPHLSHFTGSLGAINTYLKEQRDGIPFHQRYFELNDSAFVEAMNELIRSRILMLEARNLGEDFNALERDRIRYMVAERALFYPRIYQSDTNRRGEPGQVYFDFMAAFDLDNEAMMGVDNFRHYLINSLYIQSGRDDVRKNIRYIQERFKGKQIRSFLFAEVIARYIQFHGLSEVDYLLSVCRKEEVLPLQMEKVERVIDQWRKLSSGTTAPNIKMQDMGGAVFGLEELKGEYLYIAIWSSWVDAWKEEFEALSALKVAYAGKPIRFITLSVDGIYDHKNWRKYLKQHQVPGEHFMAVEPPVLYKDYLLTSLPRYLFIDPSGRIVQVKAAAPSENIRLLFRSVGL